MSWWLVLKLTLVTHRTDLGIRNFPRFNSNGVRYTDGRRSGLGRISCVVTCQNKPGNPKWRTSFNFLSSAIINLAIYHRVTRYMRYWLLVSKQLKNKGNISRWPFFIWMNNKEHKKENSCHSCLSVASILIVSYRNLLLLTKRLKQGSAAFLVMCLASFSSPPSSQQFFLKFNGLALTCQWLLFA